MTPPPKCSVARAQQQTVFHRNQKPEPFQRYSFKKLLRMSHHCALSLSSPVSIDSGLLHFIRVDTACNLL